MQPILNFRMAADKQAEISAAAKSLGISRGEFLRRASTFALLCPTALSLVPGTRNNAAPDLPDPLKKKSAKQIILAEGGEAKGRQLVENDSFPAIEGATRGLAG